MQLGRGGQKRKERDEKRRTHVYSGKKPAMVPRSSPRRNCSTARRLLSAVHRRSVGLACSVKTCMAETIDSAVQPCTKGTVVMADATPELRYIMKLRCRHVGAASTARRPSPVRASTATCNRNSECTATCSEVPAAWSKAPMQGGRGESTLPRQSHGTKLKGVRRIFPVEQRRTALAGQQGCLSRLQCRSTDCQSF